MVDQSEISAMRATHDVSHVSRFVALISTLRHYEATASSVIRVSHRQ
jgi:hypothetical protein